MTELDGEIPELVLELIEEFGADVAYTHVEGSTYDPATSSSNVAVSPPFDTKALVADYNLQGSGQAFAAGLIKAGDKQFFMAASAFELEPSPGDNISFNGGVYTTVNIKTTYSGQLAALYEIQGRT